MRRPLQTITWVTMTLALLGSSSVGAALPKASAPPPTLTVTPRPVEARRAREEAEPLSADELEARAIELGERSNRGRAIEFLERALKLAPKRGRLHRLLGVLYRDTGRIAKAEGSFRKATRLDPDDALAWADLAAVLERSGSHKEALKAANRAVALGKDDPGMRADRAIIRYRLGQLDAAIDDGVQALKSLKRAPRFAADVAMMRLTRGRRDDVTAALALLTRARALLMSDGAIALAHAQALLAAGRTKPALQAYELLLKRNGNQAWANWGRGLLAWRAKEWDRARQHGRQARKVLPHVFTKKGHNRRQFFAKDSLTYLGWLDDQLASKAPEKRIAGGPAVLESLKVRGGCERVPIREALNSVLPPLRACFSEHAGRIGLRFTADDGVAKAVTRSGPGISRDVDTCILRVVRTARLPKQTTCKVEASWNRPVQPHRAALMPQATGLLPVPAQLPPAMLNALVAPAVSPAPKPSKH